MDMARCAMSREESCDSRSRARAAAIAYGDPEPIAMMPSGLSSTSPVPVTYKERPLSQTSIDASRRRKYLSMRQSFARLTQARSS